MANILIATPNRADAATLSGGTWSGSFPLDLLKSGDISEVARSSSGANSATRFAIDLGAARHVRCIGLVNHNMASDATWRVRANSLAITLGAAGTYTYDSGVVNVKQMTFQGDTPSDWAAYYMAIATMDVTVRYFSVELFLGAAVDIGRLFIGGGLQPEINPQNMSDSWDELSSLQASVSGKAFATARNRRQRVAQLSFPALTEAEGHYLHEMQAAAGIVEEVMFLPDTEDLAECQRYGFLGRFERLDPLDRPIYQRRAAACALREKL